MASTGFEALSSEKKSENVGKIPVDADEAVPRYPSSPTSSLKPVYDDTHRRLKSRHIQLIGIGG